MSNRTRIRLRVLIAALLLALGCSPDTQSTLHSEPTVGPSVTTTAPDPVSRTPPTVAVPERRDFFIRTCDSRVGSGYDYDNAEIPILFLGPIAFLGIDFWWTSNQTHDYFKGDPEKPHEGIKFAVVVDGSAEGPVTVTIPEDNRHNVGLIYDPTIRLPTVARTDHTVKFEVCEGIHAGFEGGFIVTEPTCMTLLVVDEGSENSKEWTATIPFGVPEEACDITTRPLLPDGYVQPLHDADDV